MKKITLDELRIQCSGEFLCENLPKNFMDMEEEEIDAFIKDNAWEPFEFDEPSEIWDNIDNAALSMRDFLKSKGVKVHE